ncbi:MAG: phosphate ABC transporter permease PstA [Oscillospiraceae bacterium]
MSNKISAVRRTKSGALKAAIYFSAAVVCILAVTVAAVVLIKGLPHISVKFLTEKPSLLSGTIGILPNILNTLYIIFFTMIIVIPLGIGAAIYLNEYAKNKKLTSLIGLAAETLSGIPSIIYGLVGMLIFVQFCGFGTSLIAGALTLVIMTLPTIMRTAEESLKAVPQSYREGALALGSGKWRMLRTVVLPSAVDGIITGVILSVGRITGESAALFFTAGMANEIYSFSQAASSGNAGSTLTVSLYMYAKERGEFDTAFAIAAILLLLTVLLNFSAKYVQKHFSNRT